MRRKFGLAVVPGVSVGISLAALLAFSTIWSTAQAATYYWDPAGNGAGGGSTTWDSSNTYWSPNTGGGSDVAWPGTSNQAEFFAGSGTVDVASSLNLQNLVFDTSYTLTNTTGNGLLNFNSTASAIGLAANATILTPIGATAGTTLSITGNHTLTLQVDNILLPPHPQCM